MGNVDVSRRSLISPAENLIRSQRRGVPNVRMWSEQETPPKVAWDGYEEEPEFEPPILGPNRVWRWGHWDKGEVLPPGLLLGDVVICYLNSHHQTVMPSDWTLLASSDSAGMSVKVGMRLVDGSPMGIPHTLTLPATLPFFHTDFTIWEGFGAGGTWECDLQEMTISRDGTLAAPRPEWKWREIACFIGNMYSNIGIPPGMTITFHQGHYLMVGPGAGPQTEFAGSATPPSGSFNIGQIGGWGQARWQPCNVGWRP